MQLQSRCFRWACAAFHMATKALAASFDTLEERSCAEMPGTPLSAETNPRMAQLSCSMQNIACFEARVALDTLLLGSTPCFGEWQQVDVLSLFLFLCGARHLPCGKCGRASLADQNEVWDLVLEKWTRWDPSGRNPDGTQMEPRGVQGQILFLGLQKPGFCGVNLMRLKRAARLS